MALFNCLLNHDPSQTTKFTSSLYRHAVWEFRKAWRESSRTEQPLPALEKHQPYTLPSPETVYVNDCMDMLSPADSQILKNYHIDRMTLREIAEAYGYTAPTVLKRLRQAEASFRRLYGDD